MLTPIALNSDDFTALFKDPDYMVGAMAAVERAFVADHKRQVRAGSFGDEVTGADGKPSTLRFNLVGGQGKLDSVLGLGSGNGVNSRFVMLFDAASRELVALLDSSLLNPLRVGAEAGIAAKHLAPGAKVAAVIGSGKQAVTQVAALCNALPSLEVTRVFSPTQANREAFCRDMAGWLGHRFEPVSSVAEAIDGADIVDLINPSHAPLFETSQIKPGALVLAMSGRGEIPLDFLTRADVRVVAPSWAILSVSPVREPFLSAVREGRYTREDYGCDLGDVIVNGTQVRRAPTDIVDFEGTAMPVLEHAATEWAYAWARQNGAGTPIKL